MQENGYCMYILITSDYRLDCFCVDYHITLFSPCILLLQGNINFFCVKDCKKCGTWVGLQEKLMKFNMFEMIVQIDNISKTLNCMLLINSVSVVYGNGN